LEASPPTRHLIKAYKQLGALHEQQGDSQQALTLYRRALDLQETVRRGIG